MSEMSTSGMGARLHSGRRLRSVDRRRMKSNKIIGVGSGVGRKVPVTKWRIPTKVNPGYVGRKKKGHKTIVECTVTCERMFR